MSRGSRVPDASQWAQVHRARRRAGSSGVDPGAAAAAPEAVPRPPLNGQVAQNAARAKRISRLAQVSLLGALALLLSYLETMIPLPVGVPGIKLGLANAAVFLAFYRAGARTAFEVTLIKVLASGLLFGSPVMMAYSFGGSAVAFGALALCAGAFRLGPVPTSIAAALGHNAGQLVVAALMLQTPAVFATFPVLAVAACITGALIGAVVQAVLAAARLQGERRPVIDISALQLQPGTRVAFVGANGSGKTSCALQLAGLVCDQDTGKAVRSGSQIGALEEKIAGQTVRVKWSRHQAEDRVKCSDHQVSDHPASPSETCGLVFQDPDIQLVSEVVRDDVAFGLENRGADVSAMRREVEAALARMRLSDEAESDVTSLSGGQKQACAIAGVLVLSPQLMIFDEATSMLDAPSRGRCIQLAQDLAARGLCVVEITHDAREAFSADWLVVFSQGAIVWQGTPGELLSQPECAQKWGIALPEEARIAAELRKLGITVAADADMQQLEEAIWRS